MEPKINCDESRPYIFISYAHLDGKRVCPILERLYESGFNLWYDKIITAGTSWDDNIALHIDASAYFIAFVSENYLNSDNCKDELSYARDLNKEMLLIYLDEVNLPSGLAMRLNRSQAIIWNPQDDSYSDEDFAKIMNAQGIRKALLNSDETDEDSEEKEVGTSTPTTVSEAIPPVSHVQATQPSTDTSAQSTKDLSKVKALQIALIAAVAVLAIGLCFTLVYIFTKDKGDDSIDATTSEESVDGDEFDPYENNELKYKDALGAEQVSFEYWVDNDEEEKVSRIYYWVELHNPNQDVFIEDVKLKFTIRGQDGSTIDTSDDYCYYILAGDTVTYFGSFEDPLYEGPDIVHEVTCEVADTDWNELGDQELSPYSEITIKDDKLWCDESSGEIRFTGDITLGPNTDPDIKVLAIFYKDGKCVYLDEGYIEDLKPGEQGFSFEILALASDIPAYDDYKLKVVV